MANQRYEIRSYANALLDYLQDRSWNITEIREGFASDDPLTVPAVSVHFLPRRVDQLEMAPQNKTFTQQVQIDAYMESENRAKRILDDLLDFIDDVPIVVEDTSSAVQAHMISDSETILGDNPPLIATDPKVVRWRAVAKGVYEVHYIV